MYDHLKIKIENPFNQEQTENFKKRFLLFEVQTHDKKIYWHNAQNSNLHQNYGIYIKLRNNTFEISFSIHKFYNAVNYKISTNYNDFNFENVKTAFKQLSDVLQININEAKIIEYEYGLNIQMTLNPKDYFADVISIKQNKIIKPFTWVTYYKKYKVYSTEKHKDIRTIFQMYDKTFECLEDKIKDVPINILRVEIKHKRLSKALFIKDLLNKDFYNNCKTMIKRNFIQNIEFKKYHVKGRFTELEKEIFENIENTGVDETIGKYHNEYLHGIISEVTYKRRKKEVYKIATRNDKPEYIEKITVTEFKEKIISKLKEL